MHEQTFVTASLTATPREEAANVCQDPKTWEAGFAATAVPAGTANVNDADDE